MQHSPDGAFLLEEGDDIVLGVALVNYNRRIKPPGESQLLFEHSPLDRWLGMITVVIQPYLPDGDNALVGGFASQECREVVSPVLGMIRMQTDSPDDHGVVLDQCRRPVQALERRLIAGLGAKAQATVRRWLSKIAADLQQDR